MAQYVSDEVNKLNFKYDGDIENELIADPKFDPELPHIYIDGSIAYFAQQAHIFSKSARENIIFGKEYNQEKYQKIIQMCCL